MKRMIERNVYLIWSITLFIIKHILMFVPCVISLMMIFGIIYNPNFFNNSNDTFDYVLVFSICISSFLWMITFIVNRVFIEKRWFNLDTPNELMFYTFASTLSAIPFFGLIGVIPYMWKIFSTFLPKIEKDC